MSRKSRIWDADAAIRQACPVGMEEGVKLTIEFICGFEMFNTRAYHCYETWCGGYRVSGPAGPVGKDWQESKIITVQAEDLDDAFHLWVAKRDEAKAARPPSESPVVANQVSDTPASSPRESTPK